METLPTTQSKSLVKQPANHDLEKRINLNPLTEFQAPLNPANGTFEMQVAHANRCYPKASECDKKMFLKQLENLINKAYRDTGYHFPEDTDAGTLALDVAQDIFTEFQSLTIPEISIAFHKGVREPFPYGEIVGLSPANFYKMLYGYTNQTRVQNLIKQRKFETDQEMKAKEWKPTPDEEKVLNFYVIKALIETIYAKHPITLDSRNYTYNQLKALKIVSEVKDPEYRDKIRSQAKRELSEHLELQLKATKNAIEKQSLRTQLNAILNPVDFDKGDQQIAAQSVLIHATNCLKEYCKGKKQEEVISKIKTQLLGKLSGDELLWEAWRLKIKKPNELFKNKKYHDEFLARTEQLRKDKPMRP